MGKDSEMNEPVAWMSNGKEFYVQKNYCPDFIPLYTHPVNPKYDPETGEPLIDGYPLFSGLPHPVKELTDEEIQEVAHGFGVIGWLGDITYNFARAILRKAQEK
jgi:hypothetical protein